MKIIFSAFFIFLILTNAFPQSNTMYTLEELKSKGKDNAIQLALNLIKEKQPSLNISIQDFEIKVLANSKEILVQFRRIIRFVPLQIQKQQHVKYDITVDLIHNTISPFDDIIDSIFYVPTNSDLDAINFLQKKFGKEFSNFEVTILEEENNYLIHLENQHSYGIYTINKITGEKESSLESSYLIETRTNIASETDSFVELKD
ncbi:hypothetical protein [Flavobacterium adhaerens]|uniref:hypothetical protein n=1 Tax=Flavobacterium adhaerens TaxID=3149043 RepID=UPI0032B44BA8